MNLNKTLKTYEDGSEMTVLAIAATVAIGTTLGAIGAVAAVKYDNWKTERWLRKNNLHQERFNK